MKAQIGLFVKIFSVVLSSALFIYLAYQVLTFRKVVVEEKAFSEFKVNALNVLQKLVADKNCLAYEQNVTQEKAVIDLKKLEKFVNLYHDIEPDCAKALGFDYSVRVKQLPKLFALYPGEVIVTDEGMLFYVGPDEKCGEWGGYRMGPDRECVNVSTAVCNFNPEEYPDTCREMSDKTHIGLIKICPENCWPDPYEKCRYPAHELCCFFIKCPRNECEYITTSPCRYSHYGACYFWECNVSSCEKIGIFDVHCTRWITTKPIPSIKYTELYIPLKTWELSLKWSVESFSPEKAKEREIKVSYPIIIRYNETFSTEGIIEMYAIKGELEDVYSLIEDVCQKAKSSPTTSISFSREFKFSYPVEMKNGKLYMENSFKIIHCPFQVEFEKIEEGEHILNFVYDSTKGVIKIYEV